jgi:hypothetical protein
VGQIWRPVVTAMPNSSQGGLPADAPAATSAPICAESTPSWTFTDAQTPSGARELGLLAPSSGKR